MSIRCEYGTRPKLIMKIKPDDGDNVVTFSFDGGDMGDISVMVHRLSDAELDALVSDIVSYRSGEAIVG